MSEIQINRRTGKFVFKCFFPEVTRDSFSDPHLPEMQPRYMLHRETMVLEGKESEPMDTIGSSSSQAQPTDQASAELGSHGAVEAFDGLTETAPPYTVFSKTSKRIIVLLCAIAGFFSPFSAFTYFPALEYMAADLDVSLQLMNLTITVYLVVQGVIPAVLGDLADQIGRRPVYLIVLSVYVAACIGLALQKSYTALVVLRMLQSAGSSGQSVISLLFLFLNSRATWGNH